MNTFLKNSFNVSLICRSKSFNGLLSTASFLHLQNYKKQIKRARKSLWLINANHQPFTNRLYKTLINIGLCEVVKRLKLFNLIQEKTQQTVIGCQNGSRSKWVKMKNESAVKGLYNIYIKNIYLYRGFRDIRKRK